MIKIHCDICNKEVEIDYYLEGANRDNDYTSKEYSTAYISVIACDDSFICDNCVIAELEKLKQDIKEGTA